MHLSSNTPKVVISAPSGRFRALLRRLRAVPGLHRTPTPKPKEVYPLTPLNRSPRVSSSLLQVLLPALALSASAAVFTAPSPALAQAALTGNQATPAVTLSVSATSIAPGTPITLAATVSQSAGPLSHGLVRFCDVAVTKACTHENAIGRAQLLANGSASVKLTPAAGAHTYEAVLYGQRLFSVQVSNTLGVTVAATTSPTTAPASGTGLLIPVSTGVLASTSTIAQSGVAGNYTLAATVATHGALQPTGSVNFVDTTTGNTVLGSAPLGAVTSSLSLASSILPTGYLGGNSSVAVGDFNHDGKPDFAVVGEFSSSVTIMLGNGDGTFTAAPVAMLPINGIYQIQVADFNQDGHQDLALVNLLNNQIDLLLGNGDGTFTPGTSIYAGGGPIGITIADFNGDGIPDILRANTYAGTLSFLAGNGDGTFTQTAFNPYLGQNPTIPLAGDFNGDGKMDFAVNILNGNAVVLFLGNGDGTFTQGQTVNVGSKPGFLVSGDFNGDGKLDLAVTNQADNTVTILLGAGDGTFTAKQTVATPAGTVDLKVADFNGDGKSDLVVSGSTSNSIAILYGNGDGTFIAGPVAAAGTSPYQLAVADLNADGTPDVVIADSDSTAAVVLSSLTQTATATLTGVSLPGTGTQNVVATYTGDSSYQASVSTATILTAKAQTTSASLFVSNALPMLGQQVALTAHLAPYTGSNGEKVTFYANGKALGTATLTSGSATLNSTTIPLGIDTITVVYSGDAALSPSTSGTAYMLVWKF